MRPLISVIVPYYNSEKYLKRCVDSIISQSYTNLEIILVNDGSQDQSKTIADKLAEKDSRIVNIQIPNSGVSFARNAGLERSSGQLIMFVDSDDWMDHEIIEHLLQVKEKTNADLITCDFALSEYPQKTPSGNTSDYQLYTREEYLRLFFKIDSNKWVHYPFAKLYQKDLLPHPLYPDKIRVGEDVLGSYLAISNSNKIASLHEIGYFYYNNPDSVTSSFSKKDFDLITVWDQMINITEGRDPDYSYAVLNRERINFTLLFRLLTEVPAKERKLVYSEEEKKLLSDLRKSEANLLRSPIVKSRKILIFLLCHFYPIMKFAGNSFIFFRKLSGNKIAVAQRRKQS